MIARIWSGESPLWRLLLPLSWLYGLVSGAIRLSYKLGFKRAWRAPVPVVVVGNLTAGGNGKTPVVIWLVEKLQQRGVRVGVVSRGYGGKAAAYPLLLTPETTTAEAGDEPVLIYQRTGAPVAVAPERAAAVKAILAAHNVQIIITDDGLQHYRLARDIEIVVIDGVRRFGNGWWLPAGPMRERASRLKTVDCAKRKKKANNWSNSYRYCCCRKIRTMNETRSLRFAPAPAAMKPRCLPAICSACTAVMPNRAAGAWRS